MKLPETIARLAEVYADVVDRSGWEPGPWDDEPDKVVWVDTDTDLDCMVVRHPHLGNWCGYVGVGPEHPLYERSAHEVEAGHVEVNFATHCQENRGILSICHIPEVGRPEPVWWFGFDCGHAFDRMPGMEAGLRREGIEPAMSKFGAYRDLEYVADAVRKLAQWLANAT